MAISGWHALRGRHDSGDSILFATVVFSGKKVAQLLQDLI
jgi:hypothetical protein